MRPIQPLADIETRAPEAGRIRLGEKTGRAMKSLETFRFTSPYKDCIEALAAQYGGTVQAWSDPKASPNNQWEVKTNANQIEVFLPPNPVSTWYELYSGAGLLRRCDGETCSVPQQTGPNQWEPVSTPCICVGKQNMECSPHTRLKVLLPNVPFRGIWRLETKGWNALKELPGMADLIRQLNDSGSMVRVALGIEKRSQMRPSGKRNFVTPTLTMLDSPNQILAGGAQVQALGSVTLPELSAAPVTSPIASDNEIIDAEIVDPVEMELFHEIELLAKEHRVDRFQLWTGVLLNVKGREGSLTDEQKQRIHDAITKMKEGQLKPVGFNVDGTPIWKR
jgi:hypothetical protein